MSNRAVLTSPGNFLTGKSLADLGKLGFWVEMWKYLGWELDTKGLCVPSYQDGFNWFIAMPKGMTPDKGYGLCGDYFQCQNDNLDKTLSHNDRDARKGAYVIRVRDRIEADKEWKNFSANKIWERQIKSVALAEREVLELAVYLAAGKHLDFKNWTLCAGSHYSTGDVPVVHWSTGSRRPRVSWCNPDHAYGNLRARQAVQHQAQ